MSLGEHSRSSRRAVSGVRASFASLAQRKPRTAIHQPSSPSARKMMLARALILLLILTSGWCAGCGKAPATASEPDSSSSTAPTAQRQNSPSVEEVRTYTFSVVPQQSATKSAAQWAPLLKAVSESAGVELRFRTKKDIPEFEGSLAEGKPDLAYMNPYHYEVFHDSAGYEALARAKDKRIKGIVVARVDSDLESIEDLDGLEVAFPAPAAFAATLLPLAECASSGVKVTKKFVSSHDSVYRNVASGTIAAGGGVVRTFNAMPTEVADQLKIIWTSEGFTPHAIAAHSRVPADVVAAIQEAFVKLHETPEGMALLEPIRIKGFERGRDADWDDVRALKLEQL